MLTLAIESSGKSASVALARDDESPIERIVGDTGRRHAQTLVSEIAALFRESNTSVGQCDLIAVSIGPGSFTGLRVGVVAAKTLAYAAGARLVAVDTFEAIAAKSPPDVSQVDVIADAQRGGLFCGRYKRVNGTVWTRIGEIEVVDAEQWARSRSKGDMLSGSGIERIRAFLPESAKELSAECWTPSATSVACIGRRLSDAGELADSFTLEPFYLRPSAAEEKAAEGNTV